MTGAIPHHDLDDIEDLLTAFHEAGGDPVRQGRLAVLITEDLWLNQLIPELRCLREREHGPCHDPDNHTHAREA